jgi:hypothetical protein
MKINDSGLTVYQQRLLDCAAIVRNGKGSFDLGTWRRDEGCGTTCCAVGDYVMAVQPTDLWLEPYYTWSTGEVIYMLRSTNDLAFDAAAEHFGLSEEDCLYLFDHRRYSLEHRADRAYVANRIEQFVMEQVRA